MPADLRSWLFEEFSSRLATVFESMTGERPRIAMEKAPDIPADAALCWRQPFTGAAGVIWITASVASWKAAGGHVLQAAGIDDNDAASLKSTYLETISQALSGVAAAMGARIGGEVNCSAGEETSPAAIAAVHDAAWAVLRLQVGAASADVALGLDPVLMAALASAPAAAPAAPGIAAPEAASPEPPNSKTLELLLDVELPVSVSFGRAQVPLKDVLKLTTGSIVELNRSIHEPVEVIVNNCVIARGEVVVVEGNFGVRINQVISRQERLRTLN